MKNSVHRQLAERKLALLEIASHAGDQLRMFAAINAKFDNAIPPASFARMERIIELCKS